MTEVGEYGLALDDMAAILAHGKIAITDQERRDLLALAEQMKSEGAAARQALQPARRQEHPIQEENGRDTTAHGRSCAPLTPGLIERGAGFGAVHRTWRPGPVNSRWTAGDPRQM